MIRYLFIFIVCFSLPVLSREPLNSIHLEEEFKKLIIKGKEEEAISCMKALNLSPFDTIEQVTLMEYAVFEGRLKLLAYMLENIENINQELNYIEGSILDYLYSYKGVWKRETAHTKLLKNKKVYQKALQMIKEKGGIPIYEMSQRVKQAISQKNRAKVQNLMEQGANITHALKYYFLKIEKEDVFAQIQKDVKMYRSLGADINQVIIFFTENKELNQKLLTFTTPENMKLTAFWWNSLFSAIQYNDLEVLKGLQKRGINFNQGYNMEIGHFINPETTALQYALFLRKQEIVSFLLKNGAISTPKDWLYLFMGIFSSKVKNAEKIALVKMLRQFNISFKVIVDASLSDTYSIENVKTTPLILAIKLKQFEVAEQIYDKTHLNYVDKKRKTALDYAFESKRKRFILLLRKAGAKRSCEVLKTECHRVME